MKIFIKVNLSKENSRQVLNNIVSLLIRRGHTCSVCTVETNGGVPGRVVLQNAEDGIRDSDIVISVGGDGTLLETAPLAAKYSKPVLGVNTGHLGFLTAIEGSQTELLSKLTDSDVFKLKKHYFLQVRKNNSKPVYCLNDVVISKSLKVNTVDLTVDLNGSQLMKFVGDGIILASATGSTAYSLAVGGPIVDNDLQAMVISPVAPHTLNRASMVLSKGKTVTVKTADGNCPAYVSFDGGDYIELGKNDEIKVKVSPKYLSVYSLAGFGQLEKVDKKLKLR